MRIYSLTSLRKETERLEYKIGLNRKKLKTDVKLLRFEFIELVLKEFIGLFKKTPSKERKTGKEME